MIEYTFLLLKTITLAILANPAHFQNLGDEVIINPGTSDDAYESYDYDGSGIPAMKKEYIYEPEGIGFFKITKEELTIEMKNWFSESVSETRCSVPALTELKNIPPITCQGALYTQISETLTLFTKDYEDSNAEDKIMSVVSNSVVGSKMLKFLEKKLSKKEDEVRSLIGKLWFENQHMHPGILFPNVFMGYEEHGTEDSGNVYYPYNRSSVSWIGNYFMQQQGKEEIKTGKLSKLVDESMYLADVEVEFSGKPRKSTFIIGTTFVYDFVTYTICWMVQAKLDECLVPLPGSTGKLIEIKPVTYEADRRSSDPANKVISVFCTGFDVSVPSGAQ